MRREPTEGREREYLEREREREREYQWRPMITAAQAVCSWSLPHFLPGVGRSRGRLCSPPVSSVKTTPHTSTGGLYPDGGWKNLSGCGYERPDRRGRFQWREVGGLTFCPEERGFRRRGVRIKGVLLYFNLGVFGSITSHATIILTPPPSARKRIRHMMAKKVRGQR
jgi:hypothetical protein